MDFFFQDLKSFQSRVAVFFVSENLVLPQSLEDIGASEVASQAINYTQETQYFTGKIGEILPLNGFGDSNKKLILLVGIGNAKAVTELKLQQIGGNIASQLNRWKVETADIAIDFESEMQISPCEAARNIATGLKLKNYVYNDYYVAKRSEHVIYLNRANILSQDHEKAKDLFADDEIVIDGTLLARDLIAKPANDLFPRSFMEFVQGFSKLGLSVKVLNTEDMKALGMGALLGVGQGSAQEPYLVIIEWRGDKNSPEAPPLAFVGKGVTFDTGGVNIKTHSSISEMKYDMGGAGIVASLMSSLAKRKADVNVIGVLGLVENMVSGTAQRPSDVVKSMSGQTIEVDNTDAEGRLVLADAIWYTQKEYKPKLIIDLATLTGAITVALGDLYAGLFSNNEELAKQLTATGNKTGEYLWQLPLSEHYDKQINSEIADVKNTGSGRGAGSITAAQFLQRFTNNYPWAHLDIAGVTWNKYGTDSSPKGATGFGVRLLDKFISDYYENK